MFVLFYSFEIIEDHLSSSFLLLKKKEKYLFDIFDK
jgi:hypothetical protein